ncbi:MAG: hypothetical protein H7A35_08285 [Planctomycetales bacterium]|nr:hypothetical protein [bacterium]UNM06883.1 MAG: hypothetical protein H7A35_08285 [Planctomycetales bacterium]
MKSIVVCMGMLALLLLQGGCGGSIRQLTDDGDSDAPELIAVRPSSGVSGEQVQFEALINDLAGTLGSTFQNDPKILGNIQYIWNFGGGAYPNTVISTTPEIDEPVFLRDGIRSPYSCTLTIIGNENAEDRLVYNFSLDVAPLVIATVGPTNGQEGANATFGSVIASGNVNDDGWLWDFGGACDPNGSNETNPTVRFVDLNFADGETSRDFQGRLTVSNDFEVTTFPFTITVLRGTD